MMTEETEGNVLSLRQRMLSAVSGSLLTSIILTPMDVVRIRLQQQALLPDCSCETKNMARNITPKLVAVTPGNVVFWQTPCFQANNCKNSSVPYTGTLQTMRSIANIEGFQTLWRGLSLTLFMAIPGNIVYFTGYEYIKDISPLSNVLPSLNPVLCGAMARIVAATSVAPLELMKTRLQSIPTTTKNTKSLQLTKDMVKEICLEIKSDGYKALYKGLEITLWRDVPFSAIYWGSYEFCKNNISVNTNQNSKNSNLIHFINSFIGGTISGTLAAILTHPFDVGKTRLQISLMNNEKSTLVPNTNNNVSKNMFIYLNTIKKMEGVGALFTGLTPRVAKIAPSCAIMISSYEMSKKLFLP